MAGKKLTQLTEITFLDKDDRIYTEDISRATNDQATFISKENLESTLSLSTGGASRLISGGMQWVSGLTYQSVNLVYEIAGQQFAITDGTTIVLATADGSNPRIDLGYGDDLGALNKSTGTPAGSPVANTLPAHQFQLFIATVSASATEPDGVSIRTVFTENAGQSAEFDATESTSAARIDLANTTAPLTGTKDIKTVVADDADLITLVHATATTLVNLASIQFDIKVATDWGNDYLILKLLDSSVEVGVVNINSSFLDVTDTTSTQTVTVFKSDFSLVSGQTEFDKITIFHRVRGSSALSYQLDEFYINEDSGQTEPISILASDVSVDTTDFETNLGIGDDTVQKALETLDDVILGSVLPAVDTTAIVKGSADATKLMRFEVDGLTTATTRVITVPDEDFTLNTIKSDVTGEPTGSDRVINVVSLTQAEFDAGSPISTTLYVITDAKVLTEIMFAVSDEDTALTTGTTKFTFRMPFAMTLTDVRSNVKTAPTGSVLTVDINEGGTTILSTKLTIDATEKTSTTAATAVVISDADLADDAEITIDFDTVGSTIAGTGLKITLIGTRV